MIKFFEAFAGYGTTCFALKELGLEHELVGFSEIDKYAIKCFEQNHGGKNFGDITKIVWSEVPDFNLLTGGFPCQSFSTAGKGLGHLDKRGVLANYLTKALIEKQPEYFLFENVKGFMSRKHAEFRETLFNDWCNAGYAITYKVLNTKDFGVPQNRERVFIVGIRKDIKRFGDFVFPEPFELKLKLKDVLEEKVDEKYFLRKEQIEKLFNHLKNQKIKGNSFGVEALPMNLNGCSRSLVARDYKEPKCLMLDVSQIKREGKPRVYEDIGRTLNTAQGGGHTPLIINPYNGKQSFEESGTIGTSVGSTTGKTAQLVWNQNPRKITPKECFRLQGFLRDQINLDNLSDTQKYKLAGNGQSVNVVKLLFKELLK